MQFINGNNNVLSLYPNPDTPALIVIGKANAPKDIVGHFPTKALGELMRGEVEAISDPSRIYVSANGQALTVKSLSEGLEDIFPLDKLRTR